MLAAVALVPPFASPATDIVDGVAAIVNDRVITYSQVKEYVQPVVAQLRRSYSGSELIERVKAAQRDALDGLIDRVLIVQEFNEKGYSFPDTIVNDELNQVVVDEFGGDRAAFTKTLAAENMTVSQYREQLRERIIVQMMRGHKAQQEIVVSPYKIEKYYKDNQAQFEVGEQIKLRMIFIKKPPTTTVTKQPEAGNGKGTAPAATNTAVQANSSNTVMQTNGSNSVAQANGSNAMVQASVSNAVEQAAVTSTNSVAPPPMDARRKLAEEILAKLDAGDSFDSLARVYSEGKEAREGGDWGWLDRGVLRKELDEIAFTLKPGEHSQVIETAEGCYILQVDDVKPAYIKPLAEVRGEIEKILLQLQRTKMQEQWVKDLRAKAYIRFF